MVFTFQSHSLSSNPFFHHIYSHDVQFFRHIYRHDVQLCRRAWQLFSPLGGKHCKVKPVTGGVNHGIQPRHNLHPYRNLWHLFAKVRHRPNACMQHQTIAIGRNIKTNIKILLLEFSFLSVRTSTFT